MTRSEYMKADHSDPAVATAVHRAYYRQFVTPRVGALVQRWFGMDTLAAAYARDRHFNTPATPLRLWDALVPQLPASVPTALKAQGDWLSLGTGVCVLKEAARLLVEEPGAPELSSQG